MRIDEEKNYIDSSELDAKLTELFAKSTDVNNNERARFLAGRLGVNSKIRLLHQHLGYKVKLLILLKKQ